MNEKELLQRIEELEKTIMELKSNTEKRTSVRSKVFSRLSVAAGVFSAMLVTTALLYADKVVFHDGDLISADQVNSNFTELYDKVAALETTFAGVTRTDNVITFSGVNVMIVSGTGHTYDPPNGLGNLIVGYDEPRDSGSDKTGSHNIVLGSQNNYSSYGGIVAGFSNTISGIYASVTGGSFNQAVYDDVTHTGAYASVSGGDHNIACGNIASVSGGRNNIARGNYSTVSGGNNNTANGQYASVSGGQSNTASGNRASVSGGTAPEASGDDDWRAGELFQDH